MTQFEIGTDCQSQLAYAQTQIETLRMHKETLRRERDAYRDGYNRLTTQLAEARAEVESCRKAYAQMRSTEDEWKRDTLAALKAEVERLRPAAEACISKRDTMRVEVIR